MSFTFNSATRKESSDPWGVGGFGSTGAFYGASSGPTHSSSGSANNSGFGSSVGGSSSTTLPPPTTTTPATNLVQSSTFRTAFPGQRVYQTIQEILSVSHDDDHIVEGPMLIEILKESEIGEILSRPQLATFQPPNNTVRQQLQQQMTVVFDGREAALTPRMLQQIIQLSDDLRISEHDAIALYAEVTQDHQDSMVGRDLYFANREYLFQTQLLLCQQRARDDPNGIVMKATDALLQKGWITHLIACCLASCRRIDDLRTQLVQYTAKIANAGESKIIQQHLHHTIKERQSIAECLFFLSYQTQWTMEEVMELVDLIHNITNGSAGLARLDPFQNVPDVYETSQETHAWVVQTPRRLKSSMQWQSELVENAWQSGQPQLLRVVGTLVMAAIGCLDTKSELWDRSTHQINHFGKGNALLPPGLLSIDHLAPLDKMLDKNAAKSWDRTDILGLLMAAYAMLLRSCPSALSSPRIGPFSPSGAADTRKSYWERIEAPAEFRSFSFARLSLLSALQKPSSTDAACNVSEFLLAALTNFSTHYLDILCSSGDRPRSRAKWLQDEEEHLRWQRTDQEQQREFHNWSGTNPSNEPDVPAEVDLMSRPDCMDDVAAFATALCSLGPSYAYEFWSKETMTSGIEKLTPSRFLLDLREKQLSDASLRASYLSFLAALALAENPLESSPVSGAQTVHDMLSVEPAESFSTQETWSALLGFIFWYARELSRSSTSTAAAGTGQSSGASSAYYYFDDDSTAAHGNASSTDSSSVPKGSEPGDDSTFTLLSHLQLISTVSRRCAAARLLILCTKVSNRSSDGLDIGEHDSALTALFNLAVGPLTPEVRGKVFLVISDLLSFDAVSPEKMDVIRDAASKAWNFIEACQILPIYMLEQYPSAPQADTQLVAGLAFPPSSISLASSNNVRGWIPADPRYAIIYEMEYVESTTGVYPSTTGFLSLLKSLFDIGVCPIDLGCSWRLRPGCTPYTEYVACLVLPRVTGSKSFKDSSPLPFRTSQEKYHVSALACEILESIITRYCVEPPAMDRTTSLYEIRSYNLEGAMGTLSHARLAETVVAEPYNDKGQLLLYQDFRRFSPSIETLSLVPSIQGYVPPLIPFTGKQNHAPLDVPAPKSPGLTILVAILSSNDSTLFDSLVSLLTAVMAQTEDHDRFALTVSLYGSTPPNFSVAKQARTSSTSSFFRYTGLETMLPVSSAPSSSESTDWKDRSILSAVRLLCAALARENALETIVSASGRQKLIPVVRFHRREESALQVHVVEMKPLPLSHHIQAANMASPIVSALVDLTNYHGTNLAYSINVCTAATAIVFYLQHSLGTRKSFDLLCRPLDVQGLRLARAFGSQLLYCYGNHLLQDACDLIQFVLETILVRLRDVETTGPSLILAMLGLPCDGSSGFPSYDTPQTAEPKDCFEAVLNILEHAKFNFDGSNAPVGASCYELVYRLCDLSAGDTANCQRVKYASSILRRRDFWSVHLVMAIPRVQQAKVEQAPFEMFLIHALSWIVKGTAVELKLLSGLMSRDGQAYGNLFEWQPTQYHRFLSFLLSPNVLFELFTVIPLERLDFSDLSMVPSEDRIRSCKYALTGSSDVVDGYEIVNESLLHDFYTEEGLESHAVGVRAWVERWNRSIMRDCASAHLTNAIYLVFGCSSATTNILPPHLLIGVDQWLPIFSALLERLDEAFVMKKSQRSLDDLFYTTATRNLSIAIFMLADLLAKNNADTDTCFHACVQISRLISLSSRGLFPGPGSVRQAERTSILASSLALLLQEIRGEALNLGDCSDFIHAAKALAEIGTRLASDVVPHKAAQESIISQECLCLLLQLFNNGSFCIDGNLFCREILNAPNANREGFVVDKMIALIPLFDEDILLLLLTIIEFPDGVGILLDRGILAAILSAAQTYVGAEASYQSSIALKAAYEIECIATPPFFQSHMRILCALATAQLKTTFQKVSVTDMVSRILWVYSPIVERLVTRFPEDGEVFQLVVMCYAQLHVSSSGEIRDLTPSFVVQPYISDETLVTGLLRITSLVMHIAENPLPRRFQRPLPSLFNSTSAASDSSIVWTSVGESKTWWDGLNLDAVERDSDETCRLATLGLEVFRNGFLMIRRSRCCFERIYIFSLLKAVCRCADALKWVNQEALRTQKYFSQNVKSSNILSLQTSLLDAIEDLLVSVTKKVLQIHSDPSLQSSYIEVNSAVLVALNHASLESNTLESKHLDGGESFLLIASDIVRSLRRESEVTLSE